jgi:hypothetical protein
MRIRIELTEEGRELGARDVDVSLGDCARARETVALVSAMLLEVPRDRPPPLPDEEEKGEEKAPPPPPPPKKPPPEPPPLRAKAQPAPGVPVVVDASAFFAVTKGYLPGFGLGGRAEVILGVGRFIPLRLTAGASVGDTVETAQGSASFRAGEFTLGAAPFSASLGNRVSVFVFASGALSNVIASASGFDISRTEVRWIPSLVAGGALRVKPFGGDFIVSLEVGGFVPLSRPAFTVLDPTEPAGTTVLHRVSTAGYDLAAGAGWQFR